jgi:hypothetical protein
MAFLVEDLVESVKARSFIPISQGTFTDDDIVMLLNEELRLSLVSDILAAREDFFLTTKTQSLIANKDHYLIPTRCVGNNLKALFYVDSNSNRRMLPRQDVDRSSEYSGSSGGPEKFYFEGDEVVVMPKPSVAEGSLMFSYFRKPNALILTENCAKITAVNSLAGTTTFTVDTDLTNTDLDEVIGVGSRIDLLRGTNPYTLWSEEVSVAAITTTTIEVSTADVSDVDGSVEPRVGDYICPSGFANIPMIPEEFHGVLAQMGACRALASIGDLGKWQAAKAILEQMRTEALKLIRQRVESSPDRHSRPSSLVRAFGR